MSQFGLLRSRNKCIQFRFHLWNTNLRALILLVQGQYKILSQISTNETETCDLWSSATKLSLTHMTNPRVCSVREILVPFVPDTWDSLMTYDTHNPFCSRNSTFQIRRWLFSSTFNGFSWTFPKPEKCHDKKTAQNSWYVKSWKFIRLNTRPVASDRATNPLEFSWLPMFWGRIAEEIDSDSIHPIYFKV